MKKTVLITGAARGIGAESARLFAENNYNVVINYLSSEQKAMKLKEELQDMNCKCIAIKADVSKYDQIQKMISEVTNCFGNIDVLVNNAGISGKNELFTDITIDEWKNIFSVNVDGIFNCCKCVLPNMIRNHKGKIINISSVWGIVGASCEVHYSAAKAAVIGFTKALAKEVGPSNIQVNCVAPGVIDTEMNAELTEEDIKRLKDETPLGIIGKPIDIAESVLFLALDKSNFITGQVISPNGGFVI